MAAPAQNTNSVPPDTLITIKVSVNDSLKKLKLPLKDLGANVLPDKVRKAHIGVARKAVMPASLSSSLLLHRLLAGRYYSL